MVQEKILLVMTGRVVASESIRMLCGASKQITTLASVRSHTTGHYNSPTHLTFLHLSYQRTRRSTVPPSIIALMTHVDRYLRLKDASPDGSTSFSSTC